MAVKEVNATELIGLSTDIKPVHDADYLLGAGSTFYEIDTGNIYMYDGISTWYLQ